MTSAGGDRPERYGLTVRRAARRALAEELPFEVSFAVSDFLTGALLDNPGGVIRWYIKARYRHVVADVEQG